MNLATFIRNKRLELALTQLELSKKLGISRVYLISLENGIRSNPGLPLIREMSKVFNVSIKEIRDMLEK